MDGGAAKTWACLVRRARPPAASAVVTTRHAHPHTQALSPPRAACRRSTASLALAAGAVLWASQTAARLFVRRSPLLDGQHSVVLYPCILMYSSFALLSLY